MGLRYLPLISVLSLSLVLISCGDGGENYETVFVYFVNGYPGTEMMTVIGPTGPVSEDLKFGDRSVSPIELDRSRGTNYKFTFDSIIYEGELPLFEMYPHETATLIVDRRVDEGTLQFSFYRHVQTIDRGCVLTFDNALALSNAGRANGLSFNFTPEFRLPTSFDPTFWQGNDNDFVLNSFPDRDGDGFPGYSSAAAGVTDEANLVTFFYNECPLGIDNGVRFEDNPQAVVRKVQCCGGESGGCQALPLNEVMNTDPWFYQIIEDGSLVDRYGDRCVDADGGVYPRRPLLAEGIVYVYKSSQEYADCVGALLEPKDSELVSDPGVCPSGGIRWDDFLTNTAAFSQGLGECQALVEETAPMVSPGAESFSIIGVCGGEFRLRTPGLTSIFGPVDGDAPTLAYHQSGDYVSSQVVIPPGSEHFYVLFGRPVNPLVWQWNSGEAFVDLAQYPYFNGQSSRVIQVDTGSAPQCVQDADCKRLVGPNSLCEPKQLPFVRNECTIPQ
jgi:hypothetical protein